VDRLPCQVVFTGAPHLLVPVTDRDAVDRIRPDAPALLAVLQNAGAEGCYTFSLDPRQSGARAYARFFNPTVGIWEDPATGTASWLMIWHSGASP
jgi:PhzF family phenazine biosynthesis protein